MKLTEISGNINEWFSGAGPLADVVISSRVRLARNLTGHKFLAACSAAEKAEILKKLKDILMGLDLGDEVFYIGIDKAQMLEKQFLVERHLISQHHAFGKGPRGAVIARREFFTAMINEEDHLRLQVLKPGCQIAGCIEQIDRIDDMIEQKVEYAFNPQYGYLTACPTNLGTGIRISVMLHLPALKITGQIEKFLNAAKAMGLAVRGLFGEGTDAAGDFYQLSNQITLGVREKDIADRFEKMIIPEIVEYEHAARGRLLAKEPGLLDDKISRALALLRSAHLISSQEAMFLLSHIRLGLNMHEHQGASTPAIDRLCSLAAASAPDNPDKIGIRPPHLSSTSSRGGSGQASSPQGDGGNASDHGRLSIATVNRLFLLTLPAHLQLNYGKELDSTHRDALRAQIIRSALNG